MFTAVIDNQNLLFKSLRLYNGISQKYMWNCQSLYLLPSVAHKSIGVQAIKIVIKKKTIILLY